jgi:hypothetical protein
MKLRYCQMALAIAMPVMPNPWSREVEPSA